MTTISADMDSTVNFLDPLRLLSDCHRRVERFLNLLLKVGEEAQGGELTVEQRDSLATSLRYFQTGTALHNADEEESLFPRLRAADRPVIDEVLGTVDRLEFEHRVAEEGHREVERLGWRWFSKGRLAQDESEEFNRILRKLRTLYDRHIAIEDRLLFAVAANELSPDAIREIGVEMAVRRGLDPDDLQPVARCTARRLQRQSGADSDGILWR
ncbi:MAG TPA: hemerythrin domain-containing protein [Armatimonadota bacterium]|nr:hemerythrin domain-containing protein [Armatimonadota bacterium]